MCICVYVFLYVCGYVFCMYVCACVRVCEYVCVCVCVFVLFVVQGLSKGMIELISESDRKKLAQSLESAFTTGGRKLKTVDEDPDSWKHQFKDDEDPDKQIRFERFLEVMAGYITLQPTANIQSAVTPNPYP